MSSIIQKEKDIERQELETELHVDLIPGTEVMKNLEHVHFSSDKTGKVLIPHPSNDKHDPLNWNVFWKSLTIASALFVSFFQALGPLSVSAQSTYLMKEWNRSQADVIDFTGVCILVFGFSNFIWVPIATKWGRRPSLLLSSIVGIGACIWRAEAKSYESFMGSVILHGIASGPSETLPNMIIVDVIWLHLRGTFTAIYILSYFGAYQIGPVFSGLMAQRYGWRSFWWLNFAGYVFLTIVLIFCFPETKWNRHVGDESINLEATESESAMGNSGSEFKPTTDLVEEVQELSAAGNNCNDGTSKEVDIHHEDIWLHKGYPSKFQFQFVSSAALGYDSSFIRPIWIPIKIFAYPIIEWASFVFSFSAACFLIINLTSNMNFQAPPYNLSAETVGYFNFALFIGTCLGVATAGPFSDWVSDCSTKKNNGIREAEMRLPALIPFTLILIIGTLVTAYGYSNHWKWETIVCAGFFFIGVQVAAIPSIVNTYAIDCYKPIAGDYLVSATVNKNVWAYGVTKFFPKWIEKSGYVDPMSCIMGLTAFFLLLAIPLYFFGKSLRRITKNSSVHNE